MRLCVRVGLAEAETPLVARRCPGKLCYGANGLQKAEHVKADALVLLLGSHAAEC